MNNREIPECYKLSSYNFPLPGELIAQYPPKKRGESRLLVVDREKREFFDAEFSELSLFLPKNSLLIFNQSKVFPARLFGHKESGGKVELLFLTPLPLLDIKRDKNFYAADIEALIRPSRGIKEGRRIDFQGGMFFVVKEKGKFGKTKGTLYSPENLQQHIKRLGVVPLPPYIKRSVEKEDENRYQTIFAREDKCGSVAAPTAGLHFNQGIMEKLKEKEISSSFITLYVGHGTFSPIRKEDIREHRMHKEYVEVSEETARAIIDAKKRGRKIVAVGTTSVRTLEGVYNIYGEIRSYKGWIDLYIYPGYKFKIVDHMITNFHLPGSSLVIMVSAFAGRDLILQSYTYAIENSYRFFSYGDAMLIL